MQEKCTQISGKHGTNEGSGTVGSQAGRMRNRVWRGNDFPYYILQNKN